ncbi:MAG: S26 family signal peptidase [Halobacteriota archaeon]
MQPFIEAILATVAVSTFIAAIFFIFYLIAAKGSDSPLRLYNHFKKGYSKRSRNNRVKEKMTEYKAISGVGKPSVLRSALPFSMFLIVILVLLFKLVFLTAVTSDSMQPTFKKGDLVAMQKIATTPKEDDIIMFERPEYMLPVTHRVVAAMDGRVRTSGDARERTDPWVVRESEIMGKAIQVGGEPVVLKDVGNYFILDTREMRYGKYGLEYTFMKNVFSVIRVYGYALCVISILGYVILTLREAKGVLK